MIDLHSHILPGLDDGAQTLEQAIAMARAAVQDGIHIVAATPHHHNGQYMNEAHVVQEQLQRFNERLEEERIPLTVVGGQELRVNSQSMEELLEGRVLTLNSSRYVLIELPASSVPAAIEEWIHEMIVGGYVPIIAHPERNRAIMEQPDRLEALIELGALSQLTTHSLCGQRGGKLQRLSLRLCQRNLVHILASDAHDTVRRPFLMREAYDLIRRKLGERLELDYRANAQAVIDNRPIVPPNVTQKERKKLLWW